MTGPDSLLYISEDTLAGLDVSVGESIEIIERLIRARADGAVWCAPKAVVMPPDGRYMMATLASADDPPLQAVKSLVLNERNSERGLPQINSLISLLDSETGVPVAVMGGNWVTATRTAALSAVAAKHMARNDSASAAFIGCGVQAHSHLRAFAEMFPLTEIVAFGRGRPNIDSLCAAAADLGLAATVAETAQEAVASADLVTTSVTFSPTMVPFLDANWLKPGSFTTVTDIAAPWDKESFAAYDRVAIDDLEQEAAMPNKLINPDLVDGDLAGLVLGEFSGRENNDERTAFIFRAHPIGDFALAALAYQKVRENVQGEVLNAQ